MTPAEPETSSDQEEYTYAATSFYRLPEQANRQPVRRVAGRHMLTDYLAVAIGGAVGCCARYGVTRLIHLVYDHEFPLATLIINVLGSFLLGFLFFETLNRLSISPALRAAILVGGLGGFTTFSTFMVEALSLAENGAPWHALAYVMLSVSLGAAAAFAGGYLSRAF